MNVTMGARELSEKMEQASGMADLVRRQSRRLESG
jgi:hypothetical protein